MRYENLLVERRGAAAWITLNRPRAMNALTAELMSEMAGALDAVEGDADTRVVVITGAGRAFCAGADLKAMSAADDPGTAIGSLAAVAGPVLRRLEAFPLPVIAAVNGLALAGGFELLLACDLAIAAQSARAGDAHANFGLVPGGGGSVRLTRRVGPMRAKRLMFTGEFVEARVLEALGLVNEVVPDDQLTGAVDRLAASLAEKSPLGLRRMKEMVANALELPHQSALEAEEAMAIRHAGSRDAREGYSAFTEKRKPRFVGQ